MKLRVSCRYCKSPYRFNPCWWPLHKNYYPGGGDPPCYLDAEYDEDCRAGARMRAEAKAVRRQIITWLIVVSAALIAMIALARGEDLIEPTPQEAEDIKRWIPQMCCRTNNCCRKVHEGALIQLPQNDVRVVTTGQVLKRTGWSQDGQTWRCTCDWNDTTKNWDVHPHANTRCVFPVPTGS